MKQFKEVSEYPKVVKLHAKIEEKENEIQAVENELIQLPDSAPISLKIGKLNVEMEIGEITKVDAEKEIKSLKASLEFGDKRRKELNESLRAKKEALVFFKNKLDEAIHEATELRKEEIELYVKSQFEDARKDLMPLLKKFKELNEAEKLLWQTIGTEPHLVNQICFTDVPVSIATLQFFLLGERSHESYVPHYDSRERKIDKYEKL